MFIRGLRNLPFSTVVVLVTFSTIGFVEHQKFIKTWVKQTVPVPDFSRFGLFDIFTEENIYDEEVDLSENDSSENSSEKDEAPAEIITDPKFWEKNDRKIEERFRKRKQRLEAYCREKEINDMREWKTRNRHFYVGDAEHKLLGCVPLKAGCTSWIYWQGGLFL
ncbi:Oidioi.mRNA.OKI2018_I69.chr1.g1111.t1.cds [Oikopleura dioica]|uniref:Oidioi.mRNA.OKI2018_I69.chr1.g1111.t1.cds n=1 Tax=Oikopleura dioica TaxID=34765 RepID=A0ABN7SS48_OIKDI|nr:Oidioi.mRNA.OKI2018_I69.chr1.g1111.t1.cds [Oikopleura dioica]